MRTIPLREGPKFKSADVITQVASASPHEPMTVPAMRARLRVLDAIEQAVAAKADSLILEDADHAVLRNAMEKFPWAVADRELVAIIDDVFGAQEPPKDAATHPGRSKTSKP